jgi:hypothetical protein
MGLFGGNMGFDDIVVFIAVILAVLYLSYFLFRKKGCGCGNTDKCVSAEETDENKNDD